MNSDGIQVLRTPLAVPFRQTFFLIYSLPPPHLTLQDRFRCCLLTPSHFPKHVFQATSLFQGFVYIYIYIPRLPYSTISATCLAHR
jgi:hypothetical protein